MQLCSHEFHLVFKPHVVPVIADKGLGWEEYLPSTDAWREVARLDERVSGMNDFAVGRTSQAPTNSARRLLARAPRALIRRWVAAGAASTLVAAALVGFGAGTASATPTISCSGTCHVTFSAAGADSWTVPAGVTSLTVLAVGGGGGSASVASGGNGAWVHTTLAVSGGTSATVFVGGGGTPGAGSYGGGGGGATTLALNGTLDVIAGGGGGAGGGSNGTNGGTGAAANSSTGGAGTDISGYPNSGGYGGGGGIGASEGTVYSGGATAGSNGSSGNGGSGGQGSFTAAGGTGPTGNGNGGNGIGFSAGTAGSGGGGGGYGGGGGGGGVASGGSTTTYNTAGGGAGGSYSNGSQTVYQPSAISGSGGPGEAGEVVIAYTPPTPTATAVTPTSGTTAGGTAITVSGANFANPMTVTVGGQACTVTASTSTSVTCTTPAGTAGAADVVLTTGYSQSVTLTGGFTYQTPQVSVAPSPTPTPSPTPSASPTPRPAVPPALLAVLNAPELSSVQLLTTVGSPAATLVSLTPALCAVHGAAVAFLPATGTCRIQVEQAGHVVKTLAIGVQPASSTASGAGSAAPLHIVRSLFGPNSATLTSADQASLSAALPQLRKARIVVVLGYAANDGTGAPLSAFSVQLSDKRALAVAAYLSAHGVSVSSETRYGKAHQLPGGMATNRRADIGWAN
jgi:hypothetical protein